MGQRRNVLEDIMVILFSSLSLTVTKLVHVSSNVECFLSINNLGLDYLRKHFHQNSPYGTWAHSISLDTCSWPSVPVNWFSHHAEFQKIRGNVDLHLYLILSFTQWYVHCGTIRSCLIVVRVKIIFNPTWPTLIRCVPIEFHVKSFLPYLEHWGFDLGPSTCKANGVSLGYSLLGGSLGSISGRNIQRAQYAVSCWHGVILHQHILACSASCWERFCSKQQLSALHQEDLGPLYASFPNVKPLA